MTSDLRIRWAPKLRADRLIRLYESDARGLLDAELVDDVGWRLWERLSDVIRVSHGRVRCPGCTTEFQAMRPGDPPDVTSSCPECGWEVTADDYHRSWEHQDLNGHCDEFARFVAVYPTAPTPRARMLLIDGVVHTLHVASRSDLPGNFAARNFLEGSRPKIVALLEELASGPGSTIAARARTRWEAARATYRAGAIRRSAPGRATGNVEGPQLG